VSLYHPKYGAKCISGKRKGDKRAWSKQDASTSSGPHVKSTGRAETDIRSLENILVGDRWQPKKTGRGLYRGDELLPEGAEFRQRPNWAKRADERRKMRAGESTARVVASKKGEQES